ncbi:DUF3147 family protein [Oceanithermus desulfurans]
MLVSEIAKRSSLLGALLASVPLVSVLAMVWLYLETRDAERIAAFAQDVFWLVLPSLALFLVLPWLLRAGVQFFVALGLGLVLAALAYAGTPGPAAALRRALAKTRPLAGAGVFWLRGQDSNLRPIG